MLRLNKIYIFFGSSSFIAKELISKLKKEKNVKLYSISRNLNSKYNYQNLGKLLTVVNKIKVDEIVVFNFANNTNFLDYKNKFSKINKETFFYSKKIIDFSNRLLVKQKHIYLSSDRIFGKINKPIYISSKPRPIDPYGILKARYEKYLIKNLKIKNIIIVRSTNIYGPGQKSKQFIPNIISQIQHENKNIRVGNLENYRDYIYISDVCSALLKIKNQKNTKKLCFFHLSNTKVKLSKIVKIIKDYFHKKNIILNFSQSHNLQRNNKYELGNFKLLRYRTSKSLNWYPKISIYQGLKMILEHDFK